MVKVYYTSAVTFSEERETDRTRARKNLFFYKDCSRGGRLKTVQSKTFLTMREREGGERESLTQISCIDHLSQITWTCV